MHHCDIYDISILVNSGDLKLIEDFSIEELTKRKQQVIITN